MRSKKHGTSDRSGVDKRRSRMPGFTAGTALDGAQQGYASGPLYAVDDGGHVILPQFFRRLSGGLRSVARRAAPVVGRIARRAAPAVGRVARPVLRSPSLSLHCTGGLCRTIWSR